MRRARLSLLVCLDDGKPIHNAKSNFHVYFPTEERTGMGFVVHGDFYVKPDRTRLMKGGYNEWLLECAAKTAANELLTSLLQEYRGSSVFEALSPAESTVSDSSALLRQLFAKALQERREPFVPSSIGLLAREEILLPSAVDVEGFWQSHFESDLSQLVKNKKAFLSPAEDAKRTRAFLSLAKVDILKPDALVEFVETISAKSKDANWWYDCYCYMANEETLSRRDHSFFAGHKLIPVGTTGVAPVPTVETGMVVSLPPTGDVTALNVPKCFASIFVFLDSGVAQLLQYGKDNVLSWVLDRFRISRFEATELLPRAMRRTAPQIFAGELTITRSELINAWKFIKAVTDASRMIKSLDFWDDIGRFPLPLEQTGQVDVLDRQRMVPAFLAYWPDNWIEGNNCLWQVEGLRRIDGGFLDDLVSQSATHAQLLEFFSYVGVSKAPKPMKFSRIIPGDELLLEENGPSQFPADGFSGIRQIDVNKAVVKTILGEPLWSSTVASVASCGHGFPRVMQTLSILEGLRQCAEKAAQEFVLNEPNWEHKLWTLARLLPLSDIHKVDNDSAFCRGGMGGGHVIAAGRYIERQLRTHYWLPTSLGPSTSPDCFLRFSTRRLISSGTQGEELGDRLIPYVVVDNINDLARLQGLGVETLDDVESASVPALVRVIATLGERLASEWGQQEILTSPMRWRLVRGAIQEVYRRLNQRQENLDIPNDTRFATRSRDGVKFCAAPLYYANPGSAIEQAFMGTVPLFDADRPYARLFEQIPVTRLQSSGEGKTVEEKLLTESEASPVPRLRDEIANKLSQFLLGPVVARSERQKDIEVVIRRLRERFEVKACDHLTISFSLIAEPTVQRSVDFPKFYLQRRIVAGEGAAEEAHYVLYVAGSAKDLVADLDADALGQALAPLFFVDRVPEDIAGLFPRIAYRYKLADGKSDEMRNFLYYQLGVSYEAQDSATAVVSGDATKVGPMQIAPPLPVKVIAQPATGTGQQGLIQQSIDKHEQTLGQQLTEILRPLVSTTSSTIHTSSGGTAPLSPMSRGSRIAITAEQQVRGRRGEEEIKRRLQLPGGWAGFSLLADKRNENCGYDFLVKMGEQQVKLEVKTFTNDGRIIVTIPEMHAAAESQDDYYLVGVLDDGKPEVGWHTFVMSNPTQVLLSKGEFDIEATPHARASDVFEIIDNE